MLYSKALKKIPSGTGTKKSNPEYSWCIYEQKLPFTRVQAQQLLDLSFHATVIEKLCTVFTLIKIDYPPEWKPDAGRTTK